VLQLRTDDLYSLCTSALGGAMLKVTELYSKAIQLPMFVYGCVHGGVLNFIHLSATGVAEIAISTHFKGCPDTRVYIVH
jgi:hypothetical protein